jgi:hypothetical protein
MRVSLPDVAAANEAYMEGMANAMKGVGSVDQLQELAKQVAPMGQMGLKLFQQFMEQGVNMAAPKK